jgi:hypothetical protein
VAGATLARGSSAFTTGRGSRLLRLGSYDNFLAALLLLAVFLTCGLTPIQTDTWWQLRAGADMWASRQVLLTDTFSHSATGAFWLNHEWLAEVIFYAAYRVGGLSLLTLFSAVLIAGGWAFTWRLTRGPVRFVFVLTLLSLVSSSGWWEPRPHAFSLLFIPWMFFLLERQQGRLLPLLFLVWANCHGGVLLGFALLVIALGTRTFVNRRELQRSVVILTACAVAMTVTPLGIHFWTEIPKSLGRIQTYTLDEWERPGFREVALIPFWGIGAYYLVMLARRATHLRAVTAGDAMLHSCALTLFVAALSAVRNVGPFLMVVLPALTRLCDNGTSSAANSSRRSVERPLLNLAILLLAVLAVAAILATAYRDRWPRLKWAPVTVDAIEALRSCPDNLYNRYDEGGMLLWFVPERKVFLDGRQDPFPPRLVLEHIEMETAKRDYGPTFEEHGISCAFLPVTSPVAQKLKRNDWIVLHQDARWIVLRKP